MRSAQSELMELWKTIPGLPDYEVSTMGNLRYSFDHRPVSTRARRRGYVAATLHIGHGIVKTLAVHRLVALTWCPPPGPGQDQVNHKDGVKDNNKAENLEWATHQENADHALATGLLRPCRGEDNGSSRLSEASVIQMIGMLKEHKCSEVAKQFSVTKSLVSMVRSGKLWKHLPRPVYGHIGRNGEKHKPRLSDAEVISLRERIAGGESMTKVADELGRPYESVRFIALGLSRLEAGGPISRPTRKKNASTAIV